MKRPTKKQTVKAVIWLVAATATLALIALYPARAVALLNSVPPAVWEIFAEVVIGGLVTSAAGLAIIKWLDVNRDTMKLVSVAITSLIVAGGAYNVAEPFVAPWFIPFQAAAMAVMSQPFWFKVVKPGKKYLQKSIAEARQLNTEKASAKVPSSGLPYSTNHEGSTAQAMSTPINR